MDLPSRMPRKGENPVDWLYSIGDMSESLYRLARPGSTLTRSVAASARAADKFGDSMQSQMVMASSKPNGRVAAATSADLTGMYARNPLVAQAQVEQRVYASAVDASGGTAPTLFRSGDTPAFTASGVDPKLLLQIPWTARHAAAAEPDRAKVLDMFELLSGPDGPVMASEYEGHHGNKEYTDRVIAWQQAGYDLERQRGEERQTQVQAAQQDETRTVLGDREDWTDEQHYEHMFGALDRRAEQAKIEEQRAILEGRAVGHGYDLNKVRASMEERVAASGKRVPKNTSKVTPSSSVEV